MAASACWCTMFCLVLFEIVFNGRAGQKGPNALRKVFFLLRLSGVAVFRLGELLKLVWPAAAAALRGGWCRCWSEPPTGLWRPEDHKPSNARAAQAHDHLQMDNNETQKRGKSRFSSYVWLVLLAQVIILLPLFFPWPMPTSSAGEA